MRTYSKLVISYQELESWLATQTWQQNKSYLVQLFAAETQSATQQIAKRLIDAIPHSHLIGHSTQMLIHDGVLFDKGCQITILEFEQTDITSSVLPYQHGAEQDSYALKQALGLTFDTQAVISFSVQVERRDYQIYQSFASDDCCVAGGLAQEGCDGLWVIHQDTIYQHAAVAVALHGDCLNVWSQAYSEWNPVGVTHPITHTEGNRVLRIGNHTALQVYQHYLADGGELNIKQLLNFPLYREKHGRKEVCIALEIHDDGSITFDKPWNGDEQVQFCYTHPSLTLEQVKAGANDLCLHQPQAIMIYNCASRLDFASDGEEVAVFREIAPTHGGYCMGELFGSEAPEILHHSLTYLAMREGDMVEELTRSEDTESLTISPLFSLIRHSINDLNLMNNQMEYQLERQARRLEQSYRRDGRTGLQNRIALGERLKSIAPDEHLLTLKLLNFSHINEKYGYKVGDTLLRDLSTMFITRLRKRMGVRAALQLFSIGVGEWAFIFQADAASERIKVQFTRFADEIEHARFTPHGLDDVDYLSVSLCGGLASRRDFLNVSTDELLLKAIEARRVGDRTNTHICNAKDVDVSEDDRREQRQWLNCVSRAILDQRIITYSQPIVHAHSHEFAAQECLVRIAEDDGTIIPPGRFLPIIADTHLYTRLSRHMIKSTLSYMRDKQGAFSINLSPQDLMSDRTVRMLEQQIIQLNDPHRVGLEVLESEQISDYGRMIEVCGHLRSLGARIIVDDFGSGYSNIDEIVKLEPEVIKLDGSLIKNIHQDPKQRKIASQLVKLCQVFEAQTVAEFVHNQEVCNIAQDMGVDYLQGYYLGQPSRLF